MRSQLRLQLGDLRQSLFLGPALLFLGATLCLLCIPLCLFAGWEKAAIGR